MFKLVFFLVVALVLIIFILLAKFLRNNEVRRTEVFSNNNKLH